MQLFHWPMMSAFHGMVAMSAPALFAMAAFGPGIPGFSVEIDTTEDADEETETVEEEIDEAIEEAEDELDEAVEETEAAEEAAEVVEEAIEEAEAEEIEEAIEEAEAEAEEIEEAVEAEASQSTCWVAPSGALYHMDPDCTYIRNKDALTEMTIEEAENDDRRPCSRCAQ